MSDMWRLWRWCCGCSPILTCSVIVERWVGTHTHTCTRGGARQPPELSPHVRGARARGQRIYESTESRGGGAVVYNYVLARERLILCQQDSPKNLIMGWNCVVIDAPSCLYTCAVMWAVRGSRWSRVHAACALHVHQRGGKWLHIQEVWLDWRCWNISRCLLQGLFSDGTKAHCVGGCLFVDLSVCFSSAEDNAGIHQACLFITGCYLGFVETQKRSLGLRHMSRWGPEGCNAVSQSITRKEERGGGTSSRHSNVKSNPKKTTEHVDS